MAIHTTTRYAHVQDAMEQPGIMDLGARDATEPLMGRMTANAWLSAEQSLNTLDFLTGGREVSYTIGDLVRAAVRAAYRVDPDRWRL